MIHKAFDALALLEADNSRNAKLAVLRDQKDNSVLKRIFQLAYDWMTPYNIAQLEKTTPMDMPSVGEWCMAASFKEFEELLTALNKRTITGNVAREQVSSFLSSVSPIEHMWYQRILLRDLRVGAKEGTFLKVWPNLIAQWDIMLADTYKNQALTYPLIVEPKLDGVRITIVVKDGKGIAMTRGRQDHSERMSHIIDQITAVVPGDNVWDGEFFFETWNKSISILRSKTMTPAKIADLAKAKFHLFDCLSLEEFKAGVSKSPLTERRKTIERVLAYWKDPANWAVGTPRTINLTGVDQHWAKTEEEVMEYYDLFLEQGFEGIMIKDPRGLYVCKRGDAWLKYKPEETIDLEIVRVNLGNGRHSGRLGAFDCLTVDGEEVRVGGGFSDQQRDEFWAKRGELLGTIIEAKQQKEKVKVAKARFPIFKCIRYDRAKFEFSART